MALPGNVREKDVDAMLAEDLNLMSLQERETLYEEIHGIAQQKEETQESIQSSLRAMAIALEQIQNKPPAYHLAVQQDIQYVSSPQLWLMWLRSVSFDATKAAEGLLKMLEMKLELFGEATLTRSVCLSDLSKEDVHFLKSGGFQMLPSRDTNGRSVLIGCHMILPKDKLYQEPANFLKAFWYMFLSAAEDEETQKRGIVGILYFVGKLGGNINHDLEKQSLAIVRATPMRVMGYHICFDDPRLRRWRPLAMALMPKKLRLRVRTHDGTHTEVRYKLMTFGLPIEGFPISYLGDVKTHTHLKWIQRRQVQEEKLARQRELQAWNTRGFVSTTSFSGRDLPARSDVLLQRGRTFQDHPGNLIMRQLIDIHQHKDRAPGLQNNNQVAIHIVNEIRQRQGRFLERDKLGWWTIAAEEEAVKRVEKAIRTAKSTARLSAPKAKNPRPLVEPHRRNYSERCGAFCMEQGNKRPRLFNEKDL